MILEQENLKVLKELNIDDYKNEFIEKFLKLFPSIYKKEKLEEILKENLKKINKVEPFENKIIKGNYDYEARTINIVNENNDIAMFHEFIHSIRGKESIDELEELEEPIMFNGLIEGFTKYAEMLYNMYKRKGKIYKDEIQYVYLNKDKISFEENSYFTLANVIQELELLYGEINDKETLLETYLKNENVYIKIKDIYVRYYEKLGKMENKEVSDIEYISMQSAYKILYYLNLMYESIFETKGIRNFILETIEKEIAEIYEVIAHTNSNSKMNGLLLTTEVETREQRLLKVIFGEKIKPKQYSLKRSLNRLSDSFISRDLEA